MGTCLKLKGYKFSYGWHSIWTWLYLKVVQGRNFEIDHVHQLIMKIQSSPLEFELIALVVVATVIDTCEKLWCWFCLLLLTGRDQMPWDAGRYTAKPWICHLDVSDSVSWAVVCYLDISDSMSWAMDLLFGYMWQHELSHGFVTRIYLRLWADPWICYLDISDTMSWPVDLLPGYIWHHELTHRFATWIYLTPWADP